MFRDHHKFFFKIVLEILNFFRSNDNINRNTSHDGQHEPLIADSEKRSFLLPWSVVGRLFAIVIAKVPNPLTVNRCTEFNLIVTVWPIIPT
jgi:hypothetical protein